MADTPSHPLSNRELARAAGLSPSVLLRLFREYTGSSPQAWQLQRRIETACLLPQQEKMNVDATAEATGFYDRQHFTRHFKRRTGMTMTPARYRRQFAPFYAT